MEKLILFAPKLENQFYSKKEFEKSITPLLCPDTPAINHVVYESEERKLSFHSVSLAGMEFRRVLLDFKEDKIIFIGKMDYPVDINHGIYKWLSAMQFNFEPRKMLFVMERPNIKYT